MTAMIEMVGGPALVQAQGDVSHLVVMLKHVRQIALAGFKGEMDESEALCEINNIIVAEMKTRGENPS